MTTRRAGRIIGALFLSGFLLYGGGSLLLASTTEGALPVPGGAASLGRLSAGAALLLLNSVAVATIGILASRVLRRRHHRTATLYLATRAVEAVLLALAPLGTLTLTLRTVTSAQTSNATDPVLGRLARYAVENGPTAYWLAMAALGLGSLFFCLSLIRSTLVPRFLAVWGLVGYAVFALGSVLELAGFGVGLVLSAPGGLFELAVGGYLLVKGFGTAATQRTGDAHPTARSTTVVLPTPHATT
jgi:hypothetical protein